MSFMETCGYWAKVIAKTEERLEMLMTEEQPKKNSMAEERCIYEKISLEELENPSGCVNKPEE